MAIPYHTHNFELPIADEADIQAGVSTDKIVVPATLGTAATKNASEFATASQGAKADAAAPASRQVIAGTGLQGGGALTGNVTLSLTSNVQAAITMAANSAAGDNEIVATPPWLIGGGELDDSLIEIGISPYGEMALELALSSVQPSELGALAKKNTVAMGDISATGTRNSTTFLRGDGVWAVPAGGGGGGGSSDFNGGIITGEINNRSAYGYRLSGGSSTSPAAILYKNPNNFYILLTNENDRDGSFNNLRPFAVALGTGKVNIGHGLEVAGGVNVTSGAVNVGSAQIHGNGNVVGSLWNGWGATSAFTAIGNRIEARARSYSAENLVINGDFRVDQRRANGSTTQNLWGYDRWLNVTGGRQQYIEKVAAGVYALFWDGGGTGTLGNTSGGSPRVFTQGVTGQNLRVVVPFNASNVCVIKVNSSNDAPSLNPFSPRPFAQELQMCQRYYQKSINYALGLSTATSEAIVLPVVLTGGEYDFGVGKVRVWFTLPQRMARVPTMGFFTKGGGAGVIKLDDEGNQIGVMVPQVPFVSETMFILANGQSTSVSGDFYEFNYVADGELTSAIQ